MRGRIKAKTIAQAVTRSGDRFFSSEMRYGTNVYKRMSYVEIAERTTDWREYLNTVTALRRNGSVRAAVLSQQYWGGRS